ncbi:hypothetical protein LAZ67_13000794 [Cordylochernes scorpioides]|uniref:Uncharacterized protein n=1 Tax=Cordylochernes scorpioides TaxID=51811 RepID=A0ABY6L3A4_9ARAC|nr:hypothetical protein LAZ67_13000794 [Cordylochernes scorpioides]
MEEGVQPWHGGRSWADLVLEEVRGSSISVVGEYFFGIMVQRLAKKGLRARRGVVTVELGLVDHRGLASCFFILRRHYGPLSPETIHLCHPDSSSGANIPDYNMWCGFFSLAARSIAVIYSGPTVTQICGLQHVKMPYHNRGHLNGLHDLKLVEQASRKIFIDKKPRKCTQYQVIDQRKPKNS